VGNGVTLDEVALEADAIDAETEVTDSIGTSLLEVTLEVNADTDTDVELAADADNDADSEVLIGVDDAATLFLSCCCRSVVVCTVCSDSCFFSSCCSTNIDLFTATGGEDSLTEATLEVNADADTDVELAADADNDADSEVIIGVDVDDSATMFLSCSVSS